MKKKILTAVAAGLLALSLAGAVSATEVPPAAASVTSGGISVAVPRAEVTEWRFDVINGKLCKRLWSVTESKWLTDWAPV